MSKLAILAALIVPFVAKRATREPPAVAAPVATDDKALPAPVATVARGRISASQAVAEFMAEMRETIGGEAMLFEDVAETYRVMRLGQVEDDAVITEKTMAAMSNWKAWPRISNKTLSQMLVERGCKRFQIDLRSKGEGRPTMIWFPPDSEASGHWARDERVAVAA